MTAQNATDATDVTADDQQAAAAAAEGTEGQSQSTVEALHRALACHKAGQLDEAEALYRQVLEAHAENSDAMQLLGVIMQQRGDSEQALDFLSRALELDPKRYQIHGNLGVVLQKLGRLDEAEAHFREAIELNPADSDALGNLGHLLKDRGDDGEAEKYYRASIRYNPTPRAVHRHLANIFLGAANYPDAGEMFAEYLAAFPDDVEANNNIGLALEHSKDAAAAEPYYRKAHELMPDNAEICSNLGNTLKAMEQFEEAEKYLLKAIDLAGDNPQIKLNLAVSYMTQGRHSEAIPLLRAAIEAAPDNAELYNDIGICYGAGGFIKDAAREFAKATELDPDNPSFSVNLGTALIGMDDHVSAIGVFKSALKQHPTVVKLHANLCQAYKLNRQYTEANLYAHSSMSLPDWEPEMFPAILPAFHATGDLDGKDAMGDMLSLLDGVRDITLQGAFLDLLAEIDTLEKARKFVTLHQKWGDAYMKIAAESPLPETSFVKPAGEKIRIGVLSSDLRSHVVAKFLLPWFANYDKERFEIYCYSATEIRSDPMQARLRDMVDEFRFLTDLPDRDVAELIRADQIDVLFELNGATHNTRLSALSYRPAPVQVDWLGYPFTTGLEAMDYILVDRFMKPSVDGLLVEEELEVPGAWICFGEFPEENINLDPPFARNDGVITFGTMNAVYKFTRDIIALWAKVLKQVPNSRFLLVRPELNSQITMGNVAKAFEREGIPSDRLHFIANTTGEYGHLSYYNELDITVDTYPVVGGTTTCDALWMGVPVVGLVGETMQQRLNHAILNHCGLGEFSVETPEAYVDLAVSLANDPDRLRELRGSMRSAVRESPLCDTDGFVRGMEETITGLIEKHGLRA